MTVNDSKQPADRIVLPEHTLSNQGFIARYLVLDEDGLLLLVGSLLVLILITIATMIVIHVVPTVTGIVTISMMALGGQLSALGLGDRETRSTTFFKGEWGIDPYNNPATPKP